MFQKRGRSAVASPTLHEQHTPGRWATNPGRRVLEGSITRGKSTSRLPHKGPLDFRHLHLGFNRVGNETILMGGMMYLVELFCIGRSVTAPRNLWA